MWGCEEVVVGTLVNIVEHATSPPHCTSLFFICCHKRPNKPFSICTTSLLYLTHTSYLRHCISSSYMKNQSCVCVMKVGYRSLFPLLREARYAQVVYGTICERSYFTDPSFFAPLHSILSFIYEQPITIKFG